jgi:nucleotide-binding universal stress UspA family protein
MRQLKTILWAVDVRAPGREALGAVRQLATVFDAEVVVLHVFHSDQSYASLAYLDRKEAMRQMDVFADELTRQNVRVAATPIMTGRPAEAIVRKAQEVDADLVVMGAGSRLEFGRFTPGTVAEAVLTTAAMPVLAVRPGQPLLSFKKIVCPVDFSPASERGLRNAIGLARGTGGDVVVVTVVPAQTWLATAIETGTLVNARAEHEQSWRDEFHRFLLNIEFGGVPWSSEIASGVPHEEIVKAALKHGADLVVMGSHGRSGLTRVLLGSVTRRVLHELPCSLLTVKQEDAFGQLFEEDLRYTRLLLAEGQELLRNDVPERAAAKFRHALAANPFLVPALEGLAEAHEKMGEHDKAERCRQRLALLHHEEMTR